MSQNDVLKIINDHPDKWFNTEELSDMLDLHQTIIVTNCKKLYESGLILRREYKTKPVSYQYISIYAPKTKKKGVPKLIQTDSKWDAKVMEKKYGEGFICIQNGKIYREKKVES